MFSMNLTIIFPFLFATLFLSQVFAKRHFISSSEGNGLLSGFRLTHDWNLQKKIVCPQTEYAIGASIRTSTIPNSRLISISNIRLVCSDRFRGQTTTTSLQVGKYYEKTSDWQATQKCSRGFVVGLFVYVNLKPSGESSEMGSGSYVSGIKLVCQEGQWAVISKRTSSPYSVMFGVAFGNETATICPFGQVLSGIGVRLKSVITIEEGESLFPSEQMIQCSTPRHPFVGCEIELEFEPVSDFKCSPYAEHDYSLTALMNNSTLGSDANNISCNYRIITGIKLNRDITNLEDITHAYETTGIEITNGTWMSYIALLKMEEHEFKAKWYSLLEKIPPLDPEILWHTFVKLNEVKENFTIYDTSPRNTLTFINLAELRKINKALEQPNVTLTHSIKLEQLVGYCNVFKLYFPVVRKEASGFIREKRGRINKILEFV